MGCCQAKNASIQQIALQNPSAILTPTQNRAIANTSTIELLLGRSLSKHYLSSLTQNQLNKLLEEKLPVISSEIWHEIHADGKASASCKDEAVSPARTTRGQFRQTLTKRIGPMPAQRTWQDEFASAYTEGHNQLVKEGVHTNNEFVHTMTADEWIAFCMRGNTQLIMKAGFTRDEAPLLDAMASCPPVIKAVTIALHEKSSRFAALTHSAYNLLGSKALNSGELAPKVYASRRMLAQVDSQWDTVLEPDSTNFRGFTSYTPLLLYKAIPELYTPDCLSDFLGRGNHDNDVVCFESSAQTGRLLHTAVQTSAAGYMFPPFTLLSVARVEEAGKWEYLEGKCIQQRLITVRPTFQIPAEVSSGKTKLLDLNKFASNRNFLQYSSGEEAAVGLEDITADPVLTMEQEWARDDQWTDWKGASYSAWSEWKYVQERAGGSGHGGSGSGSGSGAASRRDKGNEGMTLQEFRNRANSYIQVNTCSPNSSRRGNRDALIPITNLLTLDEVRAIRLYTGPGYQPINIFLRELGKLGRGWRRKLARNSGFTYASTVGHLSDGLRKLVRVNNISNNSSGDAQLSVVYRGVRGELPEAFWLKDRWGAVSFTDCAFMSASTSRAVCERFLSNEASNTLWEIQCGQETDEGFHSAADVSLLSQFPLEKEVLFPPFTILQVKTKEQSDTSSDTKDAKDTLRKQESKACVVNMTMESGVQLTCVSVTPAFV